MSGLECYVCDKWVGHCQCPTKKMSISEEVKGDAMIVFYGEQKWHTDDSSVMLFSKAMRTKLARKREDGYSGWDNPEICSVQYISELLRREVCKPNCDLVDLANFAMMLHQRGCTTITLRERQ